MKKSLPFWQFSGFVFTGVFGTLLHFIYEWTNITATALFSAVNESVFEHMKILFFPMLIFAIIESRYFYKDYPAFWCVKLIGILIGLAVIPMLYYTYTGALGVSADWFNIAIFFIAAAVTYITETALLKSKKYCSLPTATSFIILLGLAVLFLVLTFVPPKIPLFQDPVTKLYGIV